jgi:hypothetical protein
VTNDFLKKNKKTALIFPQTNLTQPFGLGVKNGNVFFSNGSYYGKRRVYYYDTYSPIDFDSVDYNEDLDIICLHSLEYKFSIRIHFVSYKTITEKFWNSLDNNLGLSKSDKICKSGKVLERLQPFSAYLELYTDTTDSTLFQLLPDDSQSFSSEFLENYYIVNCLNPKDSSEELQQIKEKEHIQYMNSFSCLKYDSIEDKDLYFFSYNAIF